MSSFYSYLDWVLSHWVHFTVCRFIVFMCVYFVFFFSYCIFLVLLEHGWVDLVGLKLNP